MSTIGQSPFTDRTYANHAEYHHQEEDELDGSYADQSERQEPTEEAWKEMLQTVLSLGPLLDASAELADIRAAENAVQAKDETRASERAALDGEVADLELELKKARLASQRPSNQPTSKDHRAEVEKIEHQYTQIAKQLKEEESGVAKKEIELNRWKVEKEEVGKIQVGDEEHWADGKVIRLKLFTDAGFTLIPGKDNSTSKVLVRNDAKSDLHTVSLDKSRSKAYNANVIWGLASD